MTLFLSLIATVVVLAVVEEFASRSVYGGFANESEMDEFFPRKWDEYRENGADSRIIYGVGRLPYLSRSRGVLWAWYIKDIGRIPRWSKWSKKLDELYAEILPIKKLSDY